MKHKTARKPGSSSTTSHSRSEARARPRSALVTILYEGGLDPDRDRAIYKILRGYETGSGVSLTDGRRDITATVPVDEVAGVVRALRKVPDVEVSRRPAGAAE